MASNKFFTFFKYNNDVCKINTLRPPSSLSCSGIGFPDYNADRFIHVERPLGPGSQMFEKRLSSHDNSDTTSEPNPTLDPQAFEKRLYPKDSNSEVLVEATAVNASELIEATAVNAIEITISKKYKKKKITPTIKKHIWNTYIGHDILKHKCFCCKKTTIQINEFEAGHVLSEANGGTCEMSNFRPICRNCNLSMGSMHMEDYVKKYGLYI